MADTPSKIVVCCSDHDHATADNCDYKSKEAIVPLTPAEIAAMDQAVAAAETAAKAQADADAAKAAAKASATSKLTALGLTAEEIAALTA